MARTALKIAVAAATLMASTLVASAADLTPPPPPVISVPDQPSYSGGWYLRGDISVSAIQSISAVTFGGPSPLGNARLKTTFTGSVGGGYKISDLLRADITIGQRFRGNFMGGGSGPNSCPGAGASSIGCGSMSSQNFSSTEIMANGYVDLGKFKHVTPYIGGGVGVAYTRFGSYNTTFDCYSTTAGHCPGAAATATYHRFNRTLTGAKSWNLAWNVQAGVAVELNHRTSLDLGYKYTRIQNVKMTNDASLATQYNTRSMGFHDIRAGVRYHF